MRTACALLCSAFLILTGLSFDAHAQPNASATQVGQFFDQAQAAYAKGDWKGAYDAYTAAWALQKSYDIAGNLGNVELKLGKYRDAAEHLAFSIENFPPTGEESLQKAIQKKLAGVLTEVGRLHVQLSANGATVDGASVTVNGRPAGTAPKVAKTLFVEPGDVVVEVKLAGYLDARQQVAVAKGAEQSLTVVLVPLPQQHRSVIPGAVMGSLAGAALITGAALLGEGAAKRSDAKNLNSAIQTAHNGCIPASSNLDPRCSQLNDTALSAGTFHNTGVGMLVGAGVLGVATAAYFLWPTPKQGQASALHVVPVVSVTGTGVLVSGSF